ncbi:MAG TPA: hypothetical protein VET88_09030 [Gammaproteobacteria bacterium]|nr:hypothetical protein [Gammaproteobacteria bacterium]
MSEVKHRVGIRGAVESIYSCLTTNDGLSGWWATSSSGIAEVGNIIDLAFSDLVVLSFRYEILSANDIVKLKCVSGHVPWQDSILLFELREAADQVFVTLTHQNDSSSEDDFLYFSTKWPVYLLSLKDLIETGKGRPYPQDIKIHLGD